jgi:hypothetical protein
MELRGNKPSYTHYAVGIDSTKSKIIVDWNMAKF